MRLIDADVLERNMGIAWGESRITNDDWNLFRKILKETPTVSPDMAQVLAYECGKAERKRGKWIPVDSYSAFGGDEEAWEVHGNPIAFYYCSECKEQTYAGENGEFFTTDFCPFCGADMRGEEE